MIRVRFAPSPTGDPHIGGLRTALYNFLFARKNKGKFILRIEDTDQKRFNPKSAQRIFESLKWTNLEYDEGPLFNEKGEYIGDKGEYGPYFQSPRLKIYQKYAQKLIEEKKAYFCFCSPQRLEKLRKTQLKLKKPPRYDGLCRNLSSKEIQERLNKKIPYVIRFKIPQTGTTGWKDIIRGEITFKNQDLDDQILVKSDGFPTYHLANVVDDHLMKITHVIRAEEWISSTPKHILLYKAFGWSPPQFAHLPLILAPDRSKLSKRHGATSVLEFKKLGYLPEALINFIAFLGWNPGTEQELFTLEELIKAFDLNRVQKSGAIFNYRKLDWFNGVYIRKKSLEELTDLALPFLLEAGLIKYQNKNLINAFTNQIVKRKWLLKVIASEQERIKKLSELPQAVKFFFTFLDYDPHLLFWKKMSQDKLKASLSLLIENIEKISENEFNKEIIEKRLKDLLKKGEFEAGELFWPLRVALSGRKASPPPFEIAEILGKKETIKRLKIALQRLHSLEN